jgi:hypothetical protein
MRLPTTRELVGSRLTRMDWSPQSRTSNRCSRSPAALPRSLNSGKFFAAGKRRKGSFRVSNFQGVKLGNRLSKQACNRRVGKAERLC